MVSHKISYPGFLSFIKYRLLAGDQIDVYLTGSFDCHIISLISWEMLAKA